MKITFLVIHFGNINVDHVQMLDNISVENNHNGVVIVNHTLPWIYPLMFGWRD